MTTLSPATARRLPADTKTPKPRPAARMLAHAMPPRQTLATQIADALRRHILSGALAEGAQLRQDFVAAEFDTSHVPVREALRQLASEGLVTLSSHRSAVVSGLALADIREMTELRAKLETWLLSLSIPHMTAENLVEAEALEAEFEANDSLERWSELNWRFHEALYRPSGRSFALGTLHQIHRNAERYTRLGASLTEQQPVYREHRALIAACRNRDVLGACAILDQHICRSVDSLILRLAEARGIEPPPPPPGWRMAAQGA